MVRIMYFVPVPNIHDREKLPYWRHFIDYCWELNTRTGNGFNYGDYHNLINRELKKYSAHYDYVDNTVMFGDVEDHVWFIMEWTQ